MRLSDLPPKKLKKLISNLANIQTAYISNVKYKNTVGLENMLKIAKYNLMFELDHVGTVEKIDETAQYLNSLKLSWIQFPKKFEKLNSTKSDTPDIPKKILDMITLSSWADYELYNFVNSEIDNE